MDFDPDTVFVLVCYPTTDDRPERRRQWPPNREGDLEPTIFSIDPTPDHGERRSTFFIQGVYGNMRAAGDAIRRWHARGHTGSCDVLRFTVFR